MKILWVKKCALLCRKDLRALCHFSHFCCKNQFLFLCINPSRGSSEVRLHFCRPLVNRSRFSLKAVPQLEICCYQSKLTERGRHNKLRRGCVKEEKGWGLNCGDFNFVCLRPERLVCVERNAENIRDQRELMNKLTLNEVNSCDKKDFVELYIKLINFLLVIYGKFYCYNKFELVVTMW